MFKLDFILNSAVQVYSFLWSVPVHSPLSGHHYHLQQDIHLLEEEQDAKPSDAAEAEKNKHYSGVHLSHILYQVKICENTFPKLIFVCLLKHSLCSPAGCPSVCFAFLPSCLNCLMMQVGTL